MAVISIVGTSGVGKSTLVRQLGALRSAPCFFEGEEGTIPAKIFQTIFESSPLKRYQWFCDKYVSNLSTARKVSDAGVDCFVDGAAISVKAVWQYDDPKETMGLKRLIESVVAHKSDYVIFLIADEAYLRKAIKRRGRKSEPLKKAVARALLIQENFLRLAAQEKNSIVIDRTQLDFHNETDLQWLNSVILKKSNDLRKKAQ